MSIDCILFLAMTASDVVATAVLVGEVRKQHYSSLQKSGIFETEIRWRSIRTLTDRVVQLSIGENKFREDVSMTRSW